MKIEWKQLESAVDDLVDGKQVDWGTASQQGRDDGERRAIESLQVVASISRFDAAKRSEGTVLLPPTKAADSHWGGLTLLRKVGQGATAEVYRVEDSQLQIELALKLPRPDVMDDAECRRMLDEARALARVNHPSVVRVFRVEEHEGRAGIVMEFVRGVSLEESVRRSGTMAEGAVIRNGRVIAEALAAIHESGLIHRDVKAPNVMIEEGGRVVLMDLGCGIQRSVAESNDGGWSIAGTPYYMAPEVIFGEAPSARSDVYSLGVLLFYLATGDFPVHGTTLAALKLGHVQPREQGLADLCPELSPALVEIVEKALSREASRRFTTAAEMASALAELDLNRSTDTPVPADGGSQSWPWRWVAAGIAIVALSVWGGTQLFPSARPLDVDLALYRQIESGRERLVSGAAVSPGELLWMELSASRESHVYVLSEDDEGVSSLLFPLPGGDLANPLEAGQNQMLPGAVGGSAQGWRISSAGGRERILVIASTSRLGELEELLAGLPAAGATSYPVVSDQAMVRLRGIMELQALPDDAAGSRAFDDLFERAAELVGESSELFLHSFELANPGR